MDFTKFVSLIDSSALFFCRADLFRDPFEGSYPEANLRMRPQVYSDMTPEDRSKMFEQIASSAKTLREWTYISCWHANDFESAAMWDLYAQSDAAVAIETTYGRLAAALPEDVFLGIVRYIDYQKDWLPEGNTFYPFMHKRKSFEHEREVRAVIQDLQGVSDLFKSGKQPIDGGRSVTVDLNAMVDVIRVSPASPEWLVKLVANVAAKYGLQCAVKSSDLYSSPVY